MLPEPSEVEEPSPTLKRRQSSIDESTPKRPRLTTDSQGVNSPPAPALDTNERRRSSARGSGALEERKRGQRLFGAILGTLSQSTSSAGQRKRAEIEKRQLDKLRLRREQEDLQKKEKSEELLVARRKQQNLWDEEGMRIRHKDMLAMAHFLKTKAEPTLVCASFFWFRYITNTIKSITSHGNRDRRKKR